MCARASGRSHRRSSFGHCPVAPVPPSSVSAPGQSTVFSFFLCVTPAALWRMVIISSFAAAAVPRPRLVASLPSLDTICEKEARSTSNPHSAYPAFPQRCPYPFLVVFPTLLLWSSLLWFLSLLLALSSPSTQHATPRSSSVVVQRLLRLTPLLWQPLRGCHPLSKGGLLRFPHVVIKHLGGLYGQLNGPFAPALSILCFRVVLRSAEGRPLP